MGLLAPSPPKPQVIKQMTKGFDPLNNAIIAEGVKRKRTSGSLLGATDDNIETQSTLLGA